MTGDEIGDLRAALQAAAQGCALGMAFYAGVQARKGRSLESYITDDLYLKMQRPMEAAYDLLDAQDSQFPENTKA